MSQGYASPICYSAQPSLLIPWGLGYNAALTTTPVSNTSYFLYMGVSPHASSSVDFLYKVTSTSSVITWAEVGVFKGSLVANGNASLTRLGTADISSNLGSAASVVKNISLGTALAAGDHVWAAWGLQATGVGAWRAMLADSIQSGIHQSSAATQLSTLSSPITTGIEANNTAIPWIRLMVN